MDIDRLLFEAMNIIDKQANIKNESIGKPASVVYAEDKMCYNGVWQSYDDGSKWYEGIGFVDKYGNQMIMHFSSVNHLFITDGAGFEYYTDTDAAGSSKCIWSIHSAFIALTKMYMSGNKFALVNTTDCSDFVLVKEEAAKGTKGAKTDPGTVINFLIQTLCAMITMSSIRRFIDDGMSGKINSPEDVMNWINNDVIERISAMDIRFVSLFTNKNLQEAILSDVISTLNTLMMHMLKDKEEE